VENDYNEIKTGSKMNGFKHLPVTMAKETKILAKSIVIKEITKRNTYVYSENKKALDRVIS
jgi:hypothetical protein